VLFFCICDIQFEVFCWYLTRSIGKHLASMEQAHVITGGFYGVGDVVGRSYHEKRCEMGRTSNIWHVLPKQDSQVRHTHTPFCLTVFFAWPYANVVFAVVVWPSIRHRLVLGIVWKRLEESSSVLAWRLRSTHPTLCFREIGVPAKIRLLSSETVPNSGL